MATRKCRNIYFPKYFMAVRKFTNIYVPKYFCTSVDINGRFNQGGIFIKSLSCVINLNMHCWYAVVMFLKQPTPW